MGTDKYFTIHCLNKVFKASLQASLSNTAATGIEKPATAWELMRLHHPFLFFCKKNDAPFFRERHFIHQQVYLQSQQFQYLLVNMLGVKAKFFVQYFERSRIPKMIQAPYFSMYTNQPA